MTEDKLPAVLCYANGFCLSNSTTGGFGGVIIDNGCFTKLSGIEPKSNTPRMELISIIEVLNYYKQSREIHLFITSEYVYGGINKWIYKWAANDWLTKTKKPVANKELWKKLHELLELHDVEVHKVIGKFESEMIIECNNLAKSAITFYKKLKKLAKEG